MQNNFLFVKTFDKGMKTTIRILLSSILLLLFLLTCTDTKHAIALLRSTDHFIPHEKDKRILFEPGAKNFTNLFLPFTSRAILRVETEHYKRFKLPVQIHICKTEESFSRFYGGNTKAGVSNKLFLSPRLMREPENIEKYLIHELSHLHLYQQIGLFKMRTLPFWFKEGLATYVSNGGGAQNVIETAAIDSIKKGKHFIPHLNASWFYRRDASYWGLTPHMMYRQCMIFTAYLKTEDEKSFRNLLLAVQDGIDFEEAFEGSFQLSIEKLWQKFLQKCNSL
jgi:hypothetical protein